MQSQPKKLNPQLGNVSLTVELREWVIHQHEKRYPWMFHHLQIWGTRLSGGGWEETFLPTNFISFSLFPTPFPPHSEKFARGSECGGYREGDDNVKAGIFLRSKWSSSEEILMSRKKKKKKGKKSSSDWQSQTDCKVGFPTWRPELNCTVKTSKYFFSPFFPPSFVNCAKLQLSRNFR